MIIRVRKVQHFDWEVPDELLQFSPYSAELMQKLIDEHFDPEHISVALASDDYYEFEEIL